MAFEAPAGDWDGAAAADFALGMRLRAYRFDKYKTVKKNGEDSDDTPPSITIATTDFAAARAAAPARTAVAEGVELARDLVNEPPNVLYPEAFAERASALKGSASRSKSSTKRR